MASGGSPIMFGRLKNWLNGQRMHDPRLKCFIGVLRKSQLCDDEQVNQLIDKFEIADKGTARADIVSRFCRFLIDANAVTAWQCDKLKQGKWKGFYLDDYVLLEQVGKDRTTASYRARDIRDGASVCLIITPRNQAPYLEYRVDRSA